MVATIVMVSIPCLIGLFRLSNFIILIKVIRNCISDTYDKETMSEAGKMQGSHDDHFWAIYEQFGLVIGIFMTNRHSIAIGIFTLDMPMIQRKRRERKRRDREGREERSRITLPYLRAATQWQDPGFLPV